MGGGGMTRRLPPQPSDTHLARAVGRVVDAVRMAPLTILMNLPVVVRFKAIAELHDLRDREKILEQSILKLTAMNATLRPTLPDRDQGRRIQ